MAKFIWLNERCNDGFSFYARVNVFLVLSVVYKFFEIVSCARGNYPLLFVETR